VTSVLNLGGSDGRLAIGKSADGATVQIRVDGAVAAAEAAGTKPAPQVASVSAADNPPAGGKEVVPTDESKAPNPVETSPSLPEPGAAGGAQPTAEEQAAAQAAREAEEAAGAVPASHHERLMS